MQLGDNWDPCSYSYNPVEISTGGTSGDYSTYSPPYYNPWEWWSPQPRERHNHYYYYYGYPTYFGPHLLTEETGQKIVELLEKIAEKLDK